MKNPIGIHSTFRLHDQIPQAVASSFALQRNPHSPAAVFAGQRRASGQEARESVDDLRPIQQPREVREKVAPAHLVEKPHEQPDDDEEWKKEHASR
jgi:hypothetical protein